MKYHEAKFSWKRFKDETLNDGKLPLAVWGEKNGRKQLVDYGSYESDHDLMQSLAMLSSCFYCFDSVFYCYVEASGQFRSVTQY